MNARLRELVDSVKALISADAHGCGQRYAREFSASLREALAEVEGMGAFQRTIIPAISSDVDDVDNEPYCNECGEEDRLAYVETYANGSEYRCKTCGHEFIW